MLSGQAIMAAVSVERKIYVALCEVMDLTEQLSDAIMRKDQVSISMFLSLRREQINHMMEYEQTLEKQCAELPPTQGVRLRTLLSGDAGENEQEEVLCTQLQKNRSLLERVIAADKSVSKRLGGKKSIYK